MPSEQIHLQSRHMPCSSRSLRDLFPSTAAAIGNYRKGLLLLLLSIVRVGEMEEGTTQVEASASQVVLSSLPCQEYAFLFERD